MQEEVRTSRRTGVIAVVAAVIAFGLFVAFLPRLQPDPVVPSAASGAPVDARPVGNTVADAIGAPATSATTTTVSPTTTTIPVATTTTVPPEPEPSPYQVDPPPGVDAAVGFTVSIGNGHDGKEAVLITDGDLLTWTFRVTNEGSEYLWGVYVYLELHGPVQCDTTRLAPGQSAECIIQTTAQEGRHDAWAWVTAWTSDAMIGTDLRYTLAVIP